jgi:hypothetical protein
LTITVREVGSVAHQPSGLDIITLRISRRNPVAHCQGDKLHGTAEEEPVGSDEESIGALARKGGKGRINVADRRPGGQYRMLRTGGMLALHRIQDTQTENRKFPDIFSMLPPRSRL